MRKHYAERHRIVSSGGRGGGGPVGAWFLGNGTPRKQTPTGEGKMREKSRSSQFLSNSSGEKGYQTGHKKEGHHGMLSYSLDRRKTLHH